MMFKTGIFMELWVESTDNGISFPVVCGRGAMGWFVFLPEHEVGFTVDNINEITEDNFTQYLNIIDSYLLARIVGNAFRLIMDYGGGLKWVRKRWKKIKSSF